VIGCVGVALCECDDHGGGGDGHRGHQENVWNVFLQRVHELTEQGPLCSTVLALVSSTRQVVGDCVLFEYPLGRRAPVARIPLYLRKVLLGLFQEPVLQPVMVFYARARIL
jgi:hypothetical protein